MRRGAPSCAGLGLWVQRVLVQALWLGRESEWPVSTAWEEEERGFEVALENLELGSYSRCLSRRVKSEPCLHISVGAVGSEHCC